MARSMVAVCGIAALAIWVGHTVAEEQSRSSAASAPNTVSADQVRAGVGGRVGHLRIRPGAPAGVSACVAGAAEKLAKKTASVPAPSSS
ncbi:MAG: hypothetical protein KJ749_13260, partial [Planctomycetes bacterium]|nr:hypothetical protein [Planctomycetota bacterium]